MRVSRSGGNALYPFPVASGFLGLGGRGVLHRSYIANGNTISYSRNITLGKPSAILHICNTKTEDAI